MAGARDYNPPPPFFSSPRPFKHQIQESAAAKAYDAEWKWMNSSEAKQRSAAAKAQALSEFKKRFPHAQMSSMLKRVLSQPNFSPPSNATQKIQNFPSFSTQNSNFSHSSNLTQLICLC